MSLPAQNRGGQETAPADLQKLLQKLSRARQELRDRNRAYGSGKAQIISCLLDEIEETILPRQISVVGPKGEAAQLLVSQRRLYGVTVNGLGSAPVVAEDSEQAAAEFATRLQRLASRLEGKGFRLRRRAASPGPDLESCSVWRLKQALSQNADGGRLGRFFGECSQKSVASVLRRAGSKGQETSGHQSLHAVLTAVLDARAGQSENAPAARVSGRTPSCTILPAARGVSILVAADGPNCAALLVKAACQDAALACWQDIYGTD